MTATVRKSGGVLRPRVAEVPTSAPLRRRPQPANVRNQIVAYLPLRMFAIRNVQAPPNTTFDVPAFQSLHTVVMFDAHGPKRTRVTVAQPGCRSGEPFDTMFKHFAWGNGWTLEQLCQRLEKGPVDWYKRAAEAAARAAKNAAQEPAR